MKIVPIGENIVVKRLEAEEITAGGIVLPDAAKEKPRQGRVLSVGDGRLLSNGVRAPQQLSEGDRVVFDGYAGTEVHVNGDTLLIMREDEILAVVLYALPRSREQNTEDGIQGSGQREHFFLPCSVYPVPA